MNVNFAVVVPVFLATLAAIEPTDRPPVSSVPGAEVLRDIPELAWHVTPRAADCSVTCWDHTGTGVHIAYPDGNANERGAGSHEQPYPGSCDDNHPFCGGGGQTFAFAEELGRAVARQDIAALKWVLQHNDIYVASERGAIQVVGCDQEVIAHVGLPMNMLSALTLE